MAGYHITVNNRLYEVIDSNTDRIIATFLSENDAQVFLQGLYAKMFQEKKDMISNQLFLSNDANNFFNKVIFGDPKNNEDDSEEDIDDIDDIDFDDIDFDDINLEEDLESINESPNLYDQSNNWEEKTSPEFEFDDKTIDLTIEKFGAPLDYLNVIEKKQNKNSSNVVSNLDDNSLGEVSKYKKIEPINNSENISKVDVIDKINDNKSYNELIKETSEEEFLKRSESNPSITNLDDFETVKSDSTSEASQKFKMDIDKNANSKSDKDKNIDPIELTAIYNDILQHSSGETIEQTINNSIQSNPSIIEKIENTVEESKVVSSNVIDLGPIQEEDDIFSTPRKDAMSDSDIEKAILAGEISFLTPKQQKKKEKILKKEAKKNYKK